MIDLNDGTIKINGEKILPNSGKTINSQPVTMKGSLFHAAVYDGKHPLIQLALQDEGGVWSIERERDKKKRHDEWLAANIGNPPYLFHWGSIQSIFDEKGCVSSILIKYSDASTFLGK